MILNTNFIDYPIVLFCDVLGILILLFVVFSLFIHGDISFSINFELWAPPQKDFVGENLLQPGFITKISFIWNQFFC